MLFNNQNGVLESEKERNLYYKFFAGYFFNELVEGYKQRVSDFYKFLFPKSPDKSSFCFGKPFKLPENSNTPESVSVTFDFHGYLLDESCDKGELADILIQDNKNKLVIAIEAKFLSDWDYGKDVVGNSQRILKLEKLTKRIYQVLLLKKDKLDVAVAKRAAPNSNYKKLESEHEQERDKKKTKSDELKYPFRIITWEQLLELCEKDNIRKYFGEIIKKDKEDFRAKIEP